MESERSNEVNLCRLCMSNEELIWIFDNRITGPTILKEAIFITTNVLIEKTDMTTQKICRKCCMLVIRMLKYRENCIVNDKKLKQKCGQKIDSVCKDDTAAIPPTNKEIPSKLTKNLAIPTKLTLESQAKAKAHESVREIFKEFSGIKFERSLYSLNLKPSVAVNKKEVTEWFEKHPEPMVEEVATVGGATATAVQPEPESDEVIDVVTVTPSIIPQPPQRIATPPQPQLQQEEPPEVLPQRNSHTSINNKNNNNNNKRKLSTSSVESGTEGPHQKRKSSIEATNRIAIIGQVQQDYEVLTSNLLVANKMNQSVLLCEICNAVYYNDRYLKNHMKVHLVCQFCKIRLKNMDEKNRHLDNQCPIKSIMNNLPDLQLVRVDEDEEVMKKFPKAFKKSSGTDTPTPTTNDLEMDEIYCISDDDEVDVDTTVLHGEESSTSDTPSKDSAISVATHATTDDNASKINFVPKLKVNENRLFGAIDFNKSEHDVMKNLLKELKPPANYPTPNNDDITIRGTQDKIYILKNILSHLHLYKIPVDIQYHNKLTVSYDSYTPPEKVTKKDLWTTLKPSVMLMPGNYTSFQKANQNSQKTNLKVLSTAIPNLTPISSNQQSLVVQQQSQTVKTSTGFINLNASFLNSASNNINTLQNSSVINHTNQTVGGMNSGDETVAAVQSIQTQPTTIVTPATQAPYLPQTSSVAQIVQDSIPNRLTSMLRFMQPQPQQSWGGNPVSLASTISLPQMNNTIATTANQQQQQQISAPPKPVPQKSFIRVKPVWELT